jgi:iron(II)-dependent oxidoreductase
MGMSDLIRVPAGWFTMGADYRSVPEAEYEEGPVRRVWLPEYEICKTPVTVAEWDDFLAATGCQWSFRKDLETVSMGPDYPVSFVSWIEAQMFADWLAEKTGEGFALPTEAQWERACRGVDDRPYPWGDEKGDWIEEMGAEPLRNRPVGSQPDLASACGCLEMWTNVSEWCLDWYDDEMEWENVPREVRFPTGPSVGECKSYRGGSPVDKGWPRCSFRGFQVPTFRHFKIGFRLVRNYRDSE